MTREAAIKYSLKLEETLYPFDKKSLKMIVDKIYDDFESRTCENCKHQEGIGCEVYPSAWNWFSLNESEFSCNQWKAK